jgi:hypothetical protein
VDRPDLPSHISALLSGMAQFVRPRGTIKQVPDFGSPPVNLDFVACGVTPFAYLPPPGDDIYLEETVWTLRGKLRWSIAVVIFGGALLAAIGAIWLR